MNIPPSKDHFAVDATAIFLSWIFKIILRLMYYTLLWIEKSPIPPILSFALFFGYVRSACIVLFLFQAYAARIRVCTSSGYRHWQVFRSSRPMHSSLPLVSSHHRHRIPRRAASRT